MQTDICVDRNLQILHDIALFSGSLSAYGVFVVVSSGYRNVAIILITTLLVL